MRLSKRYLQGEVVGYFPNDSTGNTLRIYFEKGLFFFTHTPFTDKTIQAVLPEEYILNYVSLASDNTNKIILVNGFKNSDILNFATMGLLQIVDLLHNAMSSWSVYTNRPTGYIEPENTESPELQALSIKATKYALTLSDLLTQKGVSHPSFNNFSAI